MAKPPRGQSPANRQAKQEQAQAAALDELEVQSARRREKTHKLRKLRLEKENDDAARFEQWREKKASSDGVN